MEQNTYDVCWSVGLRVVNLEIEGPSSNLFPQILDLFLIHFLMIFSVFKATETFQFSKLRIKRLCTYSSKSAFWFLGFFWIQKIDFKHQGVQASILYRSRSNIPSSEIDIMQIKIYDPSVDFDFTQRFRCRSRSRSAY